MARQVLSPKGSDMLAQGEALGARTRRSRSPEGARSVENKRADIIVHIIFATKDRRPWLKDRVQEEFRLICAKHGIVIDERYAWD